MSHFDESLVLYLDDMICCILHIVTGCETQHVLVLCLAILYYCTTAMVFDRTKKSIDLLISDLNSEIIQNLFMMIIRQATMYCNVTVTTFVKCLSDKGSLA